jgi:hypothetical protein
MRVVYRFAIHSGDDTEILGAMPLADDDEARLFGAAVIRDLMADAFVHYASYTMDITRGRRMVASIPLAPKGEAVPACSPVPSANALGH